MPVQFRGRMYDLANLTPEEVAFLITHPDEFPYLTLDEDTTTPATQLSTTPATKAETTPATKPTTKAEAGKK